MPQNVTVSANQVSKKKIDTKSTAFFKSAYLKFYTYQLKNLDHCENSPIFRICETHPHKNYIAIINIT